MADSWLSRFCLIFFSLTCFWQIYPAASGAAVTTPSKNPHGPRQEGSWPYGPLTTSGRDVIDANGDVVVFAGINWSGHGEAMIPEGLQYTSIASVVSRMKGLGVNAIRLTYAIEMVDAIYDNGGQDVTVRDSLAAALGEANGTAVFEQVMANNPDLGEGATRLQVFDAVAAECARQEIYVQLDNHMSSAEWCCNTEDGNAWFGDTYFDVGRWERGLAYMAAHGLENSGGSWAALVSMSLRNELRTPESSPELEAESYNWRDWDAYMSGGAAAVHGANPDVLVVLSGLDFDTWLTPVVQGTALTPGNETFDREGFAPGFADKLVLELHNYATDAADCEGLQADMYENGYQAMHPEDEGAVNVFPVQLTEFGFEQNQTYWESVYFTCLADLLVTEKSSWFQWVISGSYYIRQGEQDMDETWGLMNHDWSDWRYPSGVEGSLVSLIDQTAT